MELVLQIRVSLNHWRLKDNIHAPRKDWGMKFIYNFYCVHFLIIVTTVYVFFYSYHGEKLNRNIPPAKRRKATKDVLISTIYDRLSEQEDTVLRTAPSTTLKYRTTTAAALNQVQFLKGEVLQTPSDSDKSTSA